MLVTACFVFAIQFSLRVKHPVPTKNSALLLPRPHATALRFKERQRFVERACSRLAESRPPLTLRDRLKLYSRLIVDDKHRLIYCSVPKAGCSSWKKVIQVLTGKASSVESVSRHQTHDHDYFTFLRPNSVAQMREIQAKLIHYKKVMVHREPLERLISAYASKFVKGDPWFLKNIGSAILRHRGLSEEEAKSGRGVRFDEFTSFVARYLTRPSLANPHWQPMANLCQPCLIRYNFYSKLDTLDEDAKYILTAIGAPKDLVLPHANPSAEKPNFKQSYTNMSTAVLSKLLELYEADYALFNYTVPNIDTSN